MSAERPGARMPISESSPVMRAGLRVASGDGLGEAGSGELRKIANGAVERKRAAGERVLADDGAAVFHADFQLAQPVSAVGHAGAGHRIGDEQGAVRSFGLPEKAHDGRVDVQAVADDLGEEVVVGEDFADQAGIAMVEAAHGVEGVGCGDGSGKHTAASGGGIGIAVTEADADAELRGVGDGLLGVRAVRERWS